MIGIVLLAAPAVALLWLAALMAAARVVSGRLWHGGEAATLPARSGCGTDRLPASGGMAGARPAPGAWPFTPPEFIARRKRRRGA